MTINTEEIKSRHDIVDIVGQYVPLKKAGKNYQACCPFHSEKSPSFTVSHDKQFYHCFGCGLHGDVIGFIQEISGCTFHEAVETLGGDVSEMKQSTPLKKELRRNIIRLPLEGKPMNEQEIELFLTEKCEEMNGCHFYDGGQVIKLTDIYTNVVSAALITGAGFNVKFFGKSFLFGSCFIFGEVSADNTNILTDDYFIGFNMHRLTGKCVICFFDPKNLNFIHQDLKRFNDRVLVVGKDKEVFNECDKLNIDECYQDNLNNKVNIDEL